MKQPQKRKYEGMDIILTGKPGGNEIIPFGHTFADGHTEVVGLRVNKPYKVGGLDETGKVIEDWVYEITLNNDLNNNRPKSRNEIKLEMKETRDGEANFQDGPTIN